MRRAALGFAMVVLLGSAARAQPFRERLSREQIADAGKNARARLPPVDHAAADACQARHGAVLGKASHSAPELAAAAACYRAAGNVGLAIRLWTALLTDRPDAAEVAEAQRQLGAAYEAAGSFSQAAQWHRTYARLHPAAPDAHAELVRAICIWRQLDIAEQANAAEQDLALLPKLMRAPKSAALCQSVHPIPN